MKLRTSYLQFLSWWNRKLAIWKLTRHNRYMLEVETLLEDCLTQELLNGDLSPQEVANERSQLLQKQYSIRKIEMFLDYLNRIK